MKKVYLVFEVITPVDPQDQTIRALVGAFNTMALAEACQVEKTESNTDPTVDYRVMETELPSVF